MNKSRPVLIIFSVLASLQFLSAGAALGDLVGSRVFGLFGLAVGAVQVGMAFYVQNLSVPIQNVAAYVAPGESPTVLAGPAAAATTGTAVTVNATDPTDAGPTADGDGP